MKLVHKLALVAMVLPGAVQAQTYPITGINISLPSNPDSKMKSDVSSPASGPTGAATDKVTNDREKKMSQKGNTSPAGPASVIYPPALSQGGNPTRVVTDKGTPTVYGQPVVITAPVNKMNDTSDAPGGVRAGVNGIRTSTLPPGTASASAKISDNESPIPSDRNFGRYATPGAAPQDITGTDAPVTITSTGMPVPLGAGGPNSPTPILVNPNMGIPTTLAPRVQNPVVQSPIMGIGGAMGPGAMSPGAMGHK